MRLLLPRRRLRPRTFRAAAGQTVLVGGVLRLDVLTCPGATLYLTVWASDDLNCHFGKTEGADERCGGKISQTLNSVGFLHTLARRNAEPLEWVRQNMVSGAVQQPDAAQHPFGA